MCGIHRSLLRGTSDIFYHRVKYSFVSDSIDFQTSDGTSLRAKDFKGVEHDAHFVRVYNRERAGVLMSK